MVVLVVVTWCGKIPCEEVAHHHPVVLLYDFGVFQVEFFKRYRSQIVVVHVLVPVYPSVAYLGYPVSVWVVWCPVFFYVDHFPPIVSLVGVDGVTRVLFCAF